MASAPLSPAATGLLDSGAAGAAGAAAGRSGAAVRREDRLPARRQRRRAAVVALAAGLPALLGLLAAGAWLARSPADARGAGGGNDFRGLATAERRTVETIVTATGVIRPRVGGEVRVGSQVSGVVKSLRVTEGSHIRRGQVIAVIDSRVTEARLAQARAQAKLDKSLRDVAAVETDLAYVVLRAPITGTIASVSTQEGETVAAAFAAPTFVTILADDALQLIVMVDETDIGNVRAGNPVRFTAEAFPARELTGRVARVAPKATIVSGVVNYEVTVEILEGARELKPDMTANVSIQTARHAALMLPAIALGREGDDRYVLVEQDGRLVRRAVTIGARDAGMTEIKSGLRAGERVAAAVPTAPPGTAAGPAAGPPNGKD